MKYGRIPFGVLSIGIILLLNLLAACPSLHEKLHPDADQPGHQCAVTVFAHGKVDSTIVEVVATEPTVSIESLPLTYVSVLSVAAVELPPGRAPPVPSVVS